MEDGINAGNHAQDYAFKTAKVTSKSRQTIRLAAGGGWAAIVGK
jgi:hypothetical protein